ncbi:MAG: inositol monophosphatase [Actinomycetota bacterium]|nr:inositol monophosphatase [Actinomycetota bacterium]
MTPIEERALLAIAYEAATAAAGELLRRFGRHQDGVRSKSTPTDLVSEADLAAEAAIRSVLAARRPNDSILGEEGGATGEGKLRWVVDPLDGTVNFLFGNPQFAVSVACEDGTGRVAGVVLDPVRAECFAAMRTGIPTLGRDLDGAPIRGSTCDRLESAMVATGFAYDAGMRVRQAEVVARVLPRARDIRRAGAAALDLAWCACGRYDAYYERGLHEWDLAAGALICERAGLAVRRLAADGQDPSGLVVAPPGLIDELLELVG